MRNQRPKRRQYWTPDQEETVRKLYPNTPTRALAIKLDRTESSVYQAAQRLGLKKSPEYLAGPASGRLDGIRGAASRFAKGHTTWNKGKPGSTGHHPNTKRTQFKKGQMTGAAQHNYVPIGSLRVTKYGSLERKVTDDPSLYPARRWRPVAHLVWEAENGPIPPGYIVRFKPGMHTTEESEITLERLECISQAENMQRNSLHRYPKEIAQAIQLRGALNRRINREQKHKPST